MEVMAEQLLKDKVALITGGARGIAKGVALALAKQGAHIVIVDREEALGRDTEAELQFLGVEAHFIAMDLVHHDKLGELVTKTVDEFGKLDILVNAAQNARPMLIVDATLESMQLPFDTGFWPTFLLMKAAYPELVKTRGSIINFASSAGYHAMHTQAAYAAAKEGVRAISRVAAREWGPDGIRVNIILPFANSPGVVAWAEDYPESFQSQLAGIPLGRIGDCEADIGAVAVFLASEAARYLTGQSLYVDGGGTVPI